MRAGGARVGAANACTTDGAARRRGPCRRDAAKATDAIVAIVPSRYGFSPHPVCATDCGDRGDRSKRGRGDMLAPSTIRRRFQLVLIKASHYDDDGYVIQWLRSSIPANSLACVYTLAADAAARHVL